MSARRLRCSQCHKNRPEDDTCLVQAKIGGDYRRPARRGQIRVCRSCTQERVDFVLRPDSGNNPLNTGRIVWEQAVRAFGIPLPVGTLLNTTGRRVLPPR